MDHRFHPHASVTIPLASVSAKTLVKKRESNLKAPNSSYQYLPLMNQNVYTVSNFFWTWICLGFQLTLVFLPNSFRVKEFFSVLSQLRYFHPIANRPTEFLTNYFVCISIHAFTILHLHPLRSQPICIPLNVPFTANTAHCCLPLFHHE